MGLSEELAIVSLVGTDAKACLALSDEAGWNQTEEDWRLFIEKGRTFGIRDGQANLIATAAAFPYEGNFGFVSMVLVTSARRREGQDVRPGRRRRSRTWPIAEWRRTVRRPAIATGRTQWKRTAVIPPIAPRYARA